MLEMENRQISLKHDTMQLLEQDLKRSTLYTKIHQTEEKLSESEWSELFMLIDATYPNFNSRLLELCSRISQEELRICYLVKVNIPVKKIAILMNITSSGVSQCRRRLYKKLTKEAENATCAPLLMSVSVVALAICCVIGGVAAPWLLPMLSAAVPLPLEPANTTVSQPMITLLLIACPLLPFIIMAICKGDRLPSRSRGAAWVCGYDHEKSMVITAHGFAMPVKQAFAPVLKLRKWLNPVSLVPGWQCEGSALLFRRMALVELAVLVVIIVSRGA